MPMMVTEGDEKMDWNKQAEEMVRTWTDVQKKMWEGWLAPVQAATDRAGENEYGKALETWETSVKRALEAQVDWTRLWAEGLGAGKAGTEAAANAAQQAHEMMKLWTDAHKQLWENWFTALRQLDPTRLGGATGWEHEAQRVMQLWQDAAKSAQEAMAEWTALWSKRR